MEGKEREALLPLQWLCQRLQELLGFEEVEGIAERMYELAVHKHSTQQLRHYTIDVLGSDDGVSAFLDEFMMKMGLSPSDSQIDSVYAAPPVRKKKKQKKKLNSATPPEQGVRSGQSVKISYQKSKSRKESPSPQRDSQTAVVMRDRKQCGCFGTKHAVFTNCLRCGRIACEVEGEGACYFCGVHVDLSIDGAESIAAVEAKDRLLGFERDKDARTHVIDDSDASEVWDEPIRHSNLLSAGQMPSSDASLSAYCHTHLTGDAKSLYDKLQEAVQQRKAEAKDAE